MYWSRQHDVMLPKSIIAVTDCVIAVADCTTAAADCETAAVDYTLHTGWWQVPSLMQTTLSLLGSLFFRSCCLVRRTTRSQWQCQPFLSPDNVGTKGGAKTIEEMQNSFLHF